jgi:hypothetical protein
MQTKRMFTPEWIPNKVAALHWRDPAANSNASISKELDMGFSEKKDLCACCIAVST